MKLEEVWDLFCKHGPETCGTHKLYVKLKRPMPNDVQEGYVFLDPRDSDGCENELYFDDILEMEDYDPFQEEVEYVYCPYCCEIIWEEKNE
jgi:hypothetical protein